MISFFLLFGVMNLVETKIPAWVIGVFALATALGLLMSAPWKKQP